MLTTFFKPIKALGKFFFEKSRLLLVLFLLGELVGFAALGFGLVGLFAPGSVGIVYGLVEPDQAQQQAFESEQAEEAKTALAGDSNWGLIAIDVAGAVNQPGLYELSSGSRLAEALAAAGGVTNKADQEYLLRQINLAQVLTDQEKVYVPFQGELEMQEERKNHQPEVNSSEAGSEETSNQPDSEKAGQAHEEVKQGLVSVNQASLEELKALEGIGEVKAQKIINNRPYQTLDELVGKEAITESLFAKIRNQLSL